jgi:hypothetical protein
MQPRRVRYACALTLLAVGPTALLSSARAADVRVEGSVRAGHLSIATKRVRVAIARDRARVADVLRVPVTVVDTRGSGHGWGIAMTATAENGKGKQVHGLAVSVSGFRVTCRSCTRPVDRIAYPLALPLRKPTNVFRAARRSGMGVMQLSGLLRVSGRPHPTAGSLAIVVRLAQISGP